MGAPEQPKVTPEANREAQKLSNKAKLAALKDEVNKGVVTADAEKAELQTAVEKLSLDISPKVFDSKNPKTFYEAVKLEVASKVTEANATKKEKIVVLAADIIYNSFVAALMDDKFFAVLADDAEKVELSATFDAKGKVTLVYKTPADEAAYETSKKKVEERLVAAVENPDPTAKKQEQFAKEYPEIFGIIDGMIPGDAAAKKAKMEAIFSGKGGLLWTVALGVMGYGPGVGMVKKWMKGDFGKMIEGYKEGIASLSKGMFDIRTPVEIGKASDLDQFYSNVVEGQQKVVEKKFTVSDKGEIILPATTTFEAIIFPKGDKTDLSLADGKGAAKDYKTEQEYEKVTIRKGEKLPPGTKFRDITIGESKVG